MYAYNSLFKLNFSREDLNKNKGSFWCNFGNQRIENSKKISEKNFEVFEIF